MFHPRIGVVARSTEVLAAKRRICVVKEVQHMQSMQTA